MKAAEAVKTLTLQEKLGILADAAKYDVACTSSGVDRKNGKKVLAMQPQQGYATALPGMAGVFPF